MILPVSHIFLNQGLVQTDNTLEQIYGLLAIIDLCRRELINWRVVCLELACLEEWNGVLD